MTHDEKNQRFVIIKEWGMKLIVIEVEKKQEP